MKSSILTISLTVLAALLLIPVVTYPDTGQTAAGSPPVSQPLVREGTFALKLIDALKLGQVSGETEAEDTLTSSGIAPRNGWIADYPVTPDIVGELRSAVAESADSGKITIAKTDALAAFEGVLNEYGLGVAQDGSGGTDTAKTYSDPTVINNYYYDNGPPVVTYYAPPPDYAYLYGWVPYPFWWWDFWFPGFFVLLDFHRTVFIHDRVFFVSNHFRDFRTHRVFVVDPVKRFHGAGFVATGTRGWTSPASRNGARAIFNNGNRTSVSGRGTKANMSPSAVNAGSRERTPRVSSGGRSTFSAPSGVSNRNWRSSNDPGRSFSSARTIAPPTDGSRAFEHSRDNTFHSSGISRTFQPRAGSDSLGSLRSGGGSSFSGHSSGGWHSSGGGMRSSGGLWRR